MVKPVGVGVIGAGNISDTYLENLTNFADTDVLAIGDIVVEAAKEKAAKYEVPAAGDVATVLDHPDIEIVVNLTIPAAHAEVASKAIAAGKHVWNEKPLALDRVSGRSLLDAAEAAGLRVGCAPDTFLGPGLQTACRLAEQGMIGTPLTALAIQTPRSSTQRGQGHFSILGLTTSPRSSRFSVQPPRWQRSDRKRATSG
jgi:predicted dehydrogenase